MKTGVVTRFLGAGVVLAGGLVALAGQVPVVAMPTSLVSEAGAQSPPPLDHFQCYQAKTASGTAKHTAARSTARQRVLRGTRHLRMLLRSRATEGRRMRTRPQEHRRARLDRSQVDQGMPNRRTAVDRFTGTWPGPFIGCINQPGELDVRM